LVDNPETPVLQPDLSAKPPLGGAKAEQEEETFAHAAEKNAEKNTAVIPLWKGGYISFNPEDSVSVFALLALILLVFGCVAVTFIGILLGDPAWLEPLTTALGYAITGVVGAILGSAATNKQ